MSITTIKNQFVHYEVLGRGTPVIFIHGWIGSWRYWWSSMQALSRYFRTFALDLWGFGDSTNLRQEYGMDGYVDMLKEFVDGLGISKPYYLVGHGLGALLAVRIARSNPKEISKLIAVSLPYDMRMLNEAIWNQDPQQFIHKHLGILERYPEVSREIGKIDDLAFHSSIDQLAVNDIRSFLGSVGVPTLMIYGRDDPVVHIDSAESTLLKKEDKSFHLVILEKSTHFPMLEQPVVFNRLVLDFIKGNYDERIKAKQHWKRRTR
jgi:pimeloyl-ACP methyl ester carboxylesterase